VAGPGDSDRMRIGDVLKQARTRQGIEIREVEERTKIRTKYLRALESEDWDVLPSPAYAKGFLRTYAQLLGIDADAVVDEYRRQVESRLEPDSPLRIGEPVLEGRRRPGEPPPGRFGPLVLVGLGVLAAIGILLVIGLVGGDEDQDEGRPKQAREKEEEGRGKRDQKEEKEKPPQPEQDPGPVALGLDVNSSVQVCLLGEGEKVLIASQVLSAGTEERFEQDRFLLRFPSGYDVGQFELILDGKPVRLPEVSGPAAYEITPGARPRPLDPPGESCP
jgi:cytoskeletal protein RodZ